VGRDPAPGHQATGDLYTAARARRDVTAEVPWILTAVEGMQEEGEGEGAEFDKVILYVGQEVR
jgi:hypothetical protein